MPELAEVDTPKTVGFVSKSAKRYQDRLKEEEKELSDLEKQGNEGVKEEETTEEEVETIGTNDKKELESKEEQTFKKRYGDLRRHHNEKVSELESRIKELESTKNETKVEYPADNETLSEWKQKYPDVARIVETVAQQIADDKIKATGHQLEEIKRGQAEFEKEKHLNTIRRKHSDFDELASSTEFHDWMEDQPRWAQQAIYEDVSDPKSAIRVIDLYKADMGLTTTAKKEKAKDAARDVESKGKTAPAEDNEGSKWRESDVAKMSPKEYEKKEEEIMDAIRKGNFIYDISAGAR